MSTSPPMTLEDAIRQSGQGWLIDQYVPPDKAMEHYCGTLDAVNRRAQERLGERAPDLSEAGVVKEFERHPRRVRGFFQVLSETRTPDMLLMAWRVIQGMRISDVQMSYHHRQTFTLRVVLESPHGDWSEVYLSSKVQDFALFRHIGIQEVSGRPVLDGFFPLKAK